MPALDAGGPLDVANYPRKPRGEHRDALSSQYSVRLSFCCANSRRRITPLSMRFLGRKVYVGGIISLISAGAIAMNDEHCSRLIEALNLLKQTLYRWHLWWTKQLPASAYWCALSGGFSPPIPPARLPGQLLVHLHGSDPGTRMVRLL